MKLASALHVILMFLLVHAFSSCSRMTTTLVLLPDTQTYAEKYPHIVEAQLRWIDSNKQNIDFVLQQGDLTQNNSDKEWSVIRSAFDIIEGKVPYTVVPGNHDMGSAPGKFADTRDSRIFNTNFPYQKAAATPHFGGAFEKGKMDNTYYLFKSGKLKWLIISLEFGPRNEVIEWANNVLRQFPERVAIVNTHSYMYSDSTTQGEGDYWRPQGYGVGKDTGRLAPNDGEQIWNKLIKPNANVRFVFSGHILNTGVGTLVSNNNAGLPVYQMLANYQEGVKGSVNGGNGFLRIVTIDKKKGIIDVKTYSPFLNLYNTNPAHQFQFTNAKF